MAAGERVASTEQQTRFSRVVILYIKLTVCAEAVTKKSAVDGAEALVLSEARADFFERCFDDTNLDDCNDV